MDPARSSRSNAPFVKATASSLYQALLKNTAIVRHAPAPDLSVLMEQKSATAAEVSAPFEATPEESRKAVLHSARLG